MIQFFRADLIIETGTSSRQSMVTGVKTGGRFVSILARSMPQRLVKIQRLTYWIPRTRNSGIDSSKLLYVLQIILVE